MIMATQAGNLTEGTPPPPSRPVVTVVNAAPSVRSPAVGTLQQQQLLMLSFMHVIYNVMLLLLLLQLARVTVVVVHRNRVW